MIKVKAVLVTKQLGVSTERGKIKDPWWKGVKAKVKQNGAKLVEKENASKNWGETEVPVLAAQQQAIEQMQ